LTLVDREGNPWIVVLPAQATQTEPGKRVAASGTFLRMIRYKAGDGERVAPLIVGPKGPTIQVPSQPSRPPSQDQVRIFTRTDWTVGLVACGLVAVVLARQMLRKPARRLRRPNDWPIADPGDREGQTP
jgi:hypothetical protein